MINLDDTKRNVLLVGGAGTGKSYILRQYAEAHPNTILCAPTGIAAVNIGGATMHSVFAIPRDSIGTRVTKKQDSAVRLLAAADAVLIDEISMARSDVFSFAMKVLQKAEKRKGSKIRVIAAGDFAQLPPVVTVEDAKRMKKAGLDPSGYAFTAPIWNKMHFQVCELTDIKRQNDLDFINALNDIRVGRPAGLKYFEPMVDASLAPSTDGAKDRLVQDIMSTHAIYICGTNIEAQTVNDACLASLTTPATGYTAEITGRVMIAPADKVVMYKPGERVIFTVNDVVHSQFQNGTLGTVSACFADHVLVQIDGGAEINVYAHTWTLYAYRTAGGAIIRSETGTERQIPLKAAYAITVHKSQGKTVDAAIVSPRTFAPGQLYVALSRVRAPTGLRLTERLTSDMLITSDEAQRFAENGYKWESKSARKAPKKTDGEKTAAKKNAKKVAKPKKTEPKKTVGKKSATVKKSKPAAKSARPAAPQAKRKSGRKTVIAKTAGRKKTVKSAGKHKTARTTRAPKKATKPAQKAKATVKAVPKPKSTAKAGGKAKPKAKPKTVVKKQVRKVMHTDPATDAVRAMSTTRL